MTRIILAAVAALSAQAALADPLDDAIKARRGYFTLLGANVGPLAAMAKGEVPYDAATATLHADNLGQLAGYSIAPHFPAGSDNVAKSGATRALPAVWSNFDDVRAKDAALDEAIAGLQAAAGGGREALGPAVGKVGAACKACHDDYRAKDF